MTQWDKDAARKWWAIDSVNDVQAESSRVELRIQVIERDLPGEDSAYLSL